MEGHDRQEAVEGDPAENWMDTALVPLCGRQFAECLQRIDPALTEGGERLTGVVGEVLALLGPAVGINARFGLYSQRLRSCDGKRCSGAR